MGALFGGGPKPPPPPPPPPQVDDATSRINAENQSLRRPGRKATILTSDTGLPNLGSTRTPGAGGQ